VTRLETDYEPIWGSLYRPGVLTMKTSTIPYIVWTMINVDDQDRNVTLAITILSGVSCYDLYHGVKFTGSVMIEANGYGAILCLPLQRASSDNVLAAFLKRMSAMTRIPLSSLSTNVPILPQTMVVYSTTQRGSSTSGMSLIPATTYDFVSNGVEIETGPGVDFQYYWETSPSQSHVFTLGISAFYIDTLPITNQQFKRFLVSSKYHPADNASFLRDWDGSGSYPMGWDDKPVTWVSVDDASAYCAWRGGRLPNEWEWQYAAQGNDGRSYPWGMQFDPTLIPTPFTGRTLPGPPDVGQFPNGASPLGVQDLIGLVWQWTNTFADAHTRAASLKGGSYYWPQGSAWYFPNVQTVQPHGKLLLISPSLDRNACTGFRCVLEV